jgi:hypothetical protein
MPTSLRWPLDAVRRQHLIEERGDAMDGSILLCERFSGSAHLSRVVIATGLPGFITSIATLL